MTPSTLPGMTEPSRSATDGSYPLARRGGQGSGVSWPAIFAGATGAAALSLILLVLGVGLGLSSVSPWSSRGVSATAFGAGTIIWILGVALASSGIGGYIAGRLRTKWAEVHSDEVYFRDTAHGFLAWAVATLLTAGLLTSTIGSVVGAGAQAGGSALAAAGSAVSSAAGGAAALAAPSRSGDSGLSYFTDTLFRPVAAQAAQAASAASAASGVAPATDATSASSLATSSAEVGRILGRSMTSGSLSADDSRYIAQLVAQRTGASPQDAERRVTDTFAKAQQSLQDAEAKAREAADKARKATAYASLWLFASLLLGAFVSSLMATFGGRQRDI